MCKYFIEIVKAANFGQNPYKLSFAIQYRETSPSPSPPSLKVLTNQQVPASTQHLGNVYYSSEPFQARS